MLWIITNDIVNDGRHNDRVSTRSAMRATVLRNTAVKDVPALVEGWKNECNFEIRLVDGGGEVCYEGVCKNLDDAMQEEAFEPQDWAEGDGVIETQYRRRGEKRWQIL